MNAGLLTMFQLQRRSRRPVPPEISRCDLLAPNASARAAVCVGLILMTVCPIWAIAAAADATELGESRTDTTQSEFERLMAVARKTQQGAGSTVHHIDTEGRPTLGNEDAQLVIVEVGSFECPYCRRHWLNTMPSLRQRYIETGKLRYVFVDVVIDPSHRHARLAAEAAHCANEQGLYAAFRDRIYRHQKAIAEAFLESHAQAVGADLPVFRRCIASGRHKARVDGDNALVHRLRVRGTPSFFWARTEPGRTDVRLLRRTSGARPVEHFARQFDALYERNPAATGTIAESAR